MPCTVLGGPAARAICAVIVVSTAAAFSPFVPSRIRSTPTSTPRGSKRKNASLDRYLVLRPIGLSPTRTAAQRLRSPRGTSRPRRVPHAVTSALRALIEDEAERRSCCGARGRSSGPPRSSRGSSSSRSAEGALCPHGHFSPNSARPARVCARTPTARTGTATRRGDRTIVCASRSCVSRCPPRRTHRSRRFPSPMRPRLRRATCTSRGRCTRRTCCSLGWLFVCTTQRARSLEGARDGADVLGRQSLRGQLGGDVVAERVEVGLAKVEALVRPGHVSTVLALRVLRRVRDVRDAWTLEEARRAGSRSTPRGAGCPRGRGSRSGR